MSTQVPLDEVVFFGAVTHNPSTGAAKDADGAVTFAVYEESTDTALGIDGSMTKRTSLTGEYRGSCTASAANGFEVGKWYEIKGYATVNGRDGKAILMHFRVVLSEAVAGAPKTDVTYLVGVAQSALDLKDFADDGYDPATNKVAGVVLVDTVASVAAGGITAASFAAGAIDAAAIATDAIGANEIAAGAVTKIQVGLASSSEVTSIQNNTRVVRVVPDVIERPDSGTTTYRVELLLYDDVGNMEAPDSAPTIELVNQAGTDRSSRLDSVTMALVETGRYRAIYTASVGDAIEQLVWSFSVVEGGAARKYGNASLIVDTTAVDFTAGDRAKLDTLHDTRLTGARATALDNLDATVGSRLATAGYTAPDNAGIAAILDDTGTAGVVVAVASKSGYALTTAPPTAADVWAAGERILTAGTNIVLAKGTGVTGFTDISAAQVNAEVLDVLNVDTFAEPGQEAPAATTTIRKMMQYLYKAWRNKSTETATAYNLYADDATTIDQKSTHSDDGATFVSGEIGTGP